MLVFLIVTSLVYLPQSPLSQVRPARAAALPSLSPDGDGTDSATFRNEAGTLCTSAVCGTSIDRDPDSALDESEFNETKQDEASAQQFYTLSNTPADFSSMGTLTVDVRAVDINDGSDDTITLYAQIFESDETAALTDEVTIASDATLTTTYAVYTGTFTLQGNNNKTVWDGARLRLRIAYTKVAGPDNLAIRYTAAELDGTYTQAVGVTVSGTLYQNDGSTVFNCSATNKTIALRVGGGGTYSTTCTAAGGTWSISSVIINSAGNVITVWVDSAGDNAATVTKAQDTSSNISSLNLWQQSVIVRQEGTATSTTNANLGKFDSDNDPEIPYTANGTTPELKVRADTKLFVWYEKTFAPGGMVVTATSTTASLPNGDLGIGSNATLNMGSNQLWVGGDFAATTTLATLTLSSGQNTYFTATSTGFDINPSSGENFENVTFWGSSGGWSNSAAMTLNGDLTMTAGTLSGTNGVTVNGGDVTGSGTISKTGGTFTVDGAGSFGGTTAWIFSSLTFGDGSGAATTTAGSSGGMTVSGTLTVANNQGLKAGSLTWTLSGSGTPLAVNGGFDRQTSTFTYTSASGVSALANRAMTGSYAFRNLTINQSGQTFTAGVALEVMNELVVAGGSLLLGSNNLTTGSSGAANSGSIKVASSQVLNQSASGTTTIRSSASGNNCIGGNAGSCAAAAGTLVFGNLTIGASASTTAFTTTFGGTSSPTSTIDGTFTINTNPTFNGGANTGIITLAGSTTPFVKTGTFTPNTVTVNYIGSSATNVTGTTYYSLGVGTTSDTAAGVTYTLAGDTTVSAVLTIGNTGSTNNDVLDASTRTLTLSGSGTPITLTSKGTFTASTSNTTYTSGSGVTALSSSAMTGTNAFYNLTINGTGNFTAGVAITANNDLTVTSGSFLLGSNALTVGSTSVASSGSIKVASGQTLNQSSAGTTQILSASGSNCIGGNAGSCAAAPGTMVFGSLTIGNGVQTFTTTLGGTTPTTTIDNVFTINTNATFNGGTGSTIRLTGAATPFSRSGTFTANTATTTYESASGVSALADVAMTGSNAFYNLKINGTGNFTAGVAVEATNELKVKSGALLMGSNALTVGSTGAANSGAIKVASGQTLNQSSGGTTTILAASGSNCIGSTGASCAGTPGTLVFGSLTIGNGTTFTTTLGGTSPTTTIDTALSIAASATFNGGTSSTINLKGSGSAMSVSGTFTANTSSVNYEGTGATTVAGATYYNLGLGTISDTGAAVTYTLGGNATSTNVLTIGNAGSTNSDTFDASSRTFTLSGAGTPITLTSRGIFEAGTSNVRYTSGSGVSALSSAAMTGSNAYYSLEINGTGNFAAGVAVTTDNDLWVLSGSLVMGSNALIVGSTGVASSGSIKVASGQTLNQASGGTTTIKSSASGSNCLGSSGASCAGTAGTLVFGSLTIGDSATTFTTTLGGTNPTTTIDSTLTITASATLNAGTGSTIRLTSSGTPISKAATGTFTAGTGTVTYASGSGISALSSAAVTGSNAFYNLTINGTGTFTAGVAVEATNELTVTSGSLLMGSNALTVGSTSVANSGSIKVASSQTFNSNGTTTIKSNGGGANCIGSSGASCAGTAGTLVFGTLTIGDAATTFTTTFGANAGTPTATVDTTLSITANATFNGGSGGTNRAINLKGSGTPFSVSGIFTANNVAINYEGTGATTITGATYYNLGAGTLSDTLTGVTYTLGGDTTVSNVLTIGNAASTNNDVLDASTRTLTLSGSGTPITLTSKGTFTASTSNTTYTSGSGVTALSSSAMTGTNAFYNLTINGTGNFTAGVAITAGNELTIAGGNLLMGSNALTVGSTSVANSGSIKVVSGHTVNQSSGGTTTILAASGSNCIGSNGASCLGTPGTLVFGNLTIGNGSNTFTTTLGGDNPTTTIDSTLTITANATLNGGTGSTFRLTSSGTPFSRAATGTFTANTSTTTYESASGVSALADVAMTGSNAFYNLKINGTGNFTAGVAIEAANELKVRSGTLLVGSNALTVGSTSNANSGSVKVASGQTLNQGSAGTTTIKSSASGSNCIGSNGASCAGTAGTLVFGNLSIGDAATVFTTTFGGTTTTTVDNVFTVTASATLNAGSATTTLTNSGTPLVVNGTFTGNASTIRYTSITGATVTALSGSSSYCDLKIVPPAGTTFTLPSGNFKIDCDLKIGDGTNAVIVNADTNDPNLDINGNFTIAANATFIASNSGSFTIAKNFTNNGTFTHSSGTITFDTTNTSIISGNSTAFNNLNSTTGGKTIKFKAQSGGVPVFTFAGTFTITGSGGGVSRIFIQSDTGGTQWLPHFNNAQSSVTYADIKDSGCDAGSAVVTLNSTSTNGGGNNENCWSFFVPGSGGAGGPSTGGGSGGGTAQGGGSSGGSGGPSGGSGSGGGTAQGGGSSGGSGSQSP